MATPVANISHLGVLSFLTQQTEHSHVSTHMNYVYMYVLLKCEQ